MTGLDGCGADPAAAAATGAEAAAAAKKAAAAEKAKAGRPLGYALFALWAALMVGECAFGGEGGPCVLSEERNRGAGGGRTVWGSWIGTGRQRMCCGATHGGTRRRAAAGRLGAQPGGCGTTETAALSGESGTARHATNCFGCAKGVGRD